MQVAQESKGISRKIAAAYTVMIFYIGNASFIYFIIETLLLGA